MLTPSRKNKDEKPFALSVQISVRDMLQNNLSVLEMIESILKAKDDIYFDLIFFGIDDIVLESSTPQELFFIIHYGEYEEDDESHPWPMHRDLLSGNKRRETSCCGRCENLGNVFHSDVSWTKYRCNVCGKIIHTVENSPSHHWNYERDAEDGEK